MPIPRMPRYGCSVYPDTLVRLIVDIAAAEEAMSRHRLYWPRDMKSTLAASVMERTDADEHLEDTGLIDWDELEKLVEPGYSDRTPRCRLAVRVHVTKPGNLSVTVHPDFYGDDGRWTSAPEWTRRIDKMHQPIMRRPQNEILFVKNIEDLFRERRDTEDSPEFTLRKLEAKGLKFAFKAVVSRIAERFDVDIMTDLVRTDEPKPGDTLLKLVDTRREHHAEIAARLAALPEETGYAADELWKVFTECRGSYRLNDTRASKQLRRAHGPAATLTPPTVLRLEAFLSMAARYGIFVPNKKPEPAAAQATEPVVAQSSEPAPGAAPAAVPRAPERRKLPKPAAEVPSPRGGLSYEGMRVVPLPAAIAEEFGVSSTIEMVDRLNELFSSRREPPLPHGSFPSGSGRMKSFVILYRSEMKGKPASS